VNISIGLNRLIHHDHSWGIGWVRPAFNGYGVMRSPVRIPNR